MSIGNDILYICCISWEEMEVAQKGNWGQHRPRFHHGWEPSEWSKESSGWTTKNCRAKEPAFGFVDSIDFLVSISLISVLIF